MKNNYILMVLLFWSCSSLNLISPGLTSENRIGKTSNAKFEESSFYGTKNYQINLFFIEKLNFNAIFDDPNNIIHQSNKHNFFKNIKESDILFLSEICFDKEKFRNRELDLYLYDYSLNGHQYLNKIEYIYPYSFTEKGTKIQLERPLIVNDNYPNQLNIIKTSEDFVTCSRSIIKFDKLFYNEGKNTLIIKTPRKSQFSFDFVMKNGLFEKQNNDDIDLNIKLKSRL
ncbi:hypothetical protein JWG40_19670 [Leptospira sp. 201903074]|uniref:hypothetical protein n=1 Tax=Leptospira abararensis TaxID=2810036 RepID=UPI0019637982|nr:hypothetical protein [Leptospira abararensis]MBM9549251.1 hypothetical protein [Leptospira abararensis]